MLPQDERIARLQLARTDGIGPITFKRLIERFGTALRALEALPDMSKRGGRAKPLIAFPRQKVETEIEKLQKLSASFLVIGDDEYPTQLAAVEDAPITLSLRGDAALLQKPGIGVVGARNASLQGRKFTETLATQLGRAGICVISGLARGIDTAAHSAALTTGTVAVIAGGVDVVYPAENAALYESIVKSGCVVAENPFGTQPLAQHFPRRNRIISGLSQGVVVVEATEKSGSLITATMAADQGREVFAVPGHPFDPRAGGPNALIRDGATIITSANDVLSALTQRSSLKIVREAPSTPHSFSMAEPDDNTLLEARDAITSILSNVPVEVDDLIRDSGVPYGILQIVLLELELAGRLTRHPQNRVSMPFSDVAMDIHASFL